MTAPQERGATAPQRKRGAWRHPYETPKERPRNPCTIPHYLGYPPNPLGRLKTRDNPVLSAEKFQEFYGFTNH